MIKHCSPGGKRWLLEIINQSWQEGNVTGQWKKAIIIPIPKNGKDPSKRDSYRPVSLTPVVVKVMERMVTKRLNYWMEKTQVINRWQAGFQRMRSTEEQVIRLSQVIQDGLEMKPHKRTVALALDCTKAYDRVWKTRLLERMMDEKVPTKILKWFKSFPEDRKSSVRFRSEKSKWNRLREGLPLSSPLLFFLFANEWNSFIEEGVEYSGFADDICIWAKDTNRKVQRASEKIVEWAKKNKLELYPTKSEACRFTNSKVDQQKEINIERKEIPVGKEVTFLGVVFERACPSINK